MKEPDDEHPYGHELIENVITFILGVILFSIGIGIGCKAIFSLKDMTYHNPKWMAKSLVKLKAISESTNNL